jgi:dimethylargininase
MYALTHQPSPQINEYQCTFVERTTIDFDAALQQHRDYCAALTRMGVSVRQLSGNSQYPDSVFIEDTAILLDEIAILTSMGTQSRAGESAHIAAELAEVRDLRFIRKPATLEGGDVLRIGRTLLVGLTSRTNADGIAQLTELLRPFGYTVVPVRVDGSLHLKTACTALPDGSLLVNPDWVHVDDLSQFRCWVVPENEPWAANTLPVHEFIMLPQQHVATADLLGEMGFAIQPVDISEFAKAEGGVTCLSILYSK